MQLEIPIDNLTTKCTPFLRWAGGKSWFVKYLKDYIPVDYNTYHEVFLGGAAVFFNLNYAGTSYLSDLNKDLIDTYIQVRDNVELVINELKTFQNNKDTYYKIRGEKYTEEYKKAAQFIFLNRTSFNGIYRVNRNGNYNVPFGFRYTIDHIIEDTLRKASTKLSDTILISQDFESAVNNIKRNDFVFIDPPYTVAHENNGFVEYNQKIFSLEDQYRLYDALKKLKDIGAYFVLTNAYHVKIKEIYDGIGDFNILTRHSTIGGKGAKRENIKEYIIKNF